MEAILKGGTGFDAADHDAWEASHFDVEASDNVIDTGGFKDYENLGSVELYKVDGKNLSVRFTALTDCKDTLNSAIERLGGRSNDYKRRYTFESPDSEKNVLNPLHKPLIPRRRHIDGDTSSDAAIAITKNWLEICCCQTASPSAVSVQKGALFLPFRAHVAMQRVYQLSMRC